MESLVLDLALEPGVPCTGHREWMNLSHGSGLRLSGNMGNRPVGMPTLNSSSLQRMWPSYYKCVCNVFACGVMCKGMSGYVSIDV